MITIETLNDVNIKEINNYWIYYWKNRNLNYDINYLKLDRMLECFLFRNNQNLAMISGIDDISQFLPNTYRILTRATTTKYRPICVGEYVEEKFFSNVMAGISVDYCQKIDKNKNIVITTNHDSRISRIVKKSKKKWLRYAGIINIYGIKQIVWNIDLDECKKLTNIWKNKLGII